MLNVPPPALFACDAHLILEMVLSTRKSARLAASVSTTTTPTPAISPIFSAKTSVQSETPETSDIDEGEGNRPKKTVAMSRGAQNGKKRARESDSEQETRTKRSARPRAHTVYVEIQTSVRALKVGTITK